MNKQLSRPRPALFFSLMVLLAIMHNPAVSFSSDPQNKQQRKAIIKL